MVVIENGTGEVRAMVGGRNYATTPFNLATEGERQPGSSFKAFDLAAALEDGISPESVWPSHVKVFVVPGTHGQEKFVVHNDEGAYSGSNTLTGATAYSDNSIYAEVGLRVGTERIADLARRMGITTPLSTNPAMTIGGLKVGVTPLDMAHSYETIARGGERISGSLVSDLQPVGIQEVQAGSQVLPDGHRDDLNRVIVKRVLPVGVASTETSMLATVLQYGTARAAAIGQFAAGKTGTTSNYGDAWFVGWNSKYTVAVWVGYPNSLVPMTNAFNGGPVLGGTFPALIWHDFITSSMQIDKAHGEADAAKRNGGRGATSTSTSEATTPSTTSPAPAIPAGPGKSPGKAAPPPSGRSPSPPTGGEGGSSSGRSSGERGSPHAAPEAPAPSPSPPAQAPAPAAPAPGSGPGPPTGGVSPGTSGK
jgi:penicillin-binding protein 1A